MCLLSAGPEGHALGLAQRTRAPLCIVQTGPAAARSRLGGESPPGVHTGVALEGPGVQERLSVVRVPHDLAFVPC